MLTAGALHDAAVRLRKDTGSLYLLGIPLICPRMMPAYAWRFSEPARARSHGYSSSAMAAQYRPLERRLTGKSRLGPEGPELADRRPSTRARCEPMQQTFRSIYFANA